MNKIIFLPSNIETECNPKESVFKAATRTGISIPATCGGAGSCGQCSIIIVDGEEYLNKQTKSESIHLGNVYHLNKKRLSCQVKFIAEGAITVKTDE